MNSHDILMTFVVASALGVFLLMLAQHIRISAIVVLLLGGIVAGPEVLGLLEPANLGNGLNTIVSIAVGLILFEGGLTLDPQGYRQVSKEILGVLTKGVLVTWVASAVAIHLIFDFDWVFCFLSSSLIIVTGPTVIGPLLQRIRVKKRLHHILHWEGVLIDPVGVFIALLSYEWVVSLETGGALVHFFTRFVVGSSIGLAFGLGIYQVLKRNWVRDDIINIFILVTAMLNFGIADHFAHESGLLSVTVAGFIVGYRKTAQLGQIIRYKVELKDYLIGLLFVLLAANLELKKFLTYGPQLILMVLVVMFLVRPLNIFVSSWRSNLTVREKLFLSWIAPRGIVAASMASLFAFQLSQNNIPHAAFLETFTYSVIAGTVIFQGFTAGGVGRLLGVLEPKPKDWLIIGAHKVSRVLARFIQDQGQNVVVLDSNPREIKLAIQEGIPAIYDNAKIATTEDDKLYGVGNIVALTQNEELNCFFCQRWGKAFSGANLYRWCSDDFNNPEENLAGTPIWTDINLKALLADSKDSNLETQVVVANPTSKQAHGRVMAHFFKKEIVLDNPKQSGGVTNILLLAHREEEKQIPTHQKWVVFSEEQTLSQLYTGMLETLLRDYPLIEKENILAELNQREEEFTSLIGHGISLPHTYTDAISETLVMVTRVTPPIPCRHTGSDIALVFMVLSPENNPVEHLNQISKIAKFIMKEENRVSLLKAESAEQLYAIIES